MSSSAPPHHNVRSNGDVATSAESAAAVASNAPGAGWTNGELMNSMYPYSRSGRMAMYQARRWIPLTTGWTRIGEGATEFDARHSSSQSGEQVAGEEGEDPGDAVKALMAQLCQNFYQQGWATGTGGGVSIRILSNNTWRVFVAPSGIQKEDMIADDIFEMDMNQNIVAPPKTPNLRPSACTPLWFCVYRHRPNAKCVIHTHSMHAQLATLLDPTEKSKSLKITHLEMLKGVGNHAYDDILEIPIIDNRPTEDALADQLELALQQYPKANAVLVRRHGLYAWGDTWEQAKTQCESFDYLFQTAVLMKTQLSMDPGQIPRHGTYREDAVPPAAAAAAAASARVKVKMEEGMGEDEHDEENNDHRKVAEPPTKKRGRGNLKSETNDLVASPISRQPGLLLPRDAKVLILDINGCTTPVSFFEDVLSPFILSDTKWAIDTEYDGYREEMEIGEVIGELENELEAHKLKDECERDLKNAFPDDNYDNSDYITHQVQWMARRNFQGKDFKGVQGLVWRVALENEKFRGQVFSDLLPMLQWMRQYGIAVYTFSSDITEQAQEPFFKMSTSGNLSQLIRSHYDIYKAGLTKDPKSFHKLLKAIQGKVKASDCVFVSAGEAELTAARQAGLKAVLSVRLGNPPVSEEARNRFPAVESLLQLCGE